MFQSRNVSGRKMLYSFPKRQTHCDLILKSITPFDLTHHVVFNTMLCKVILTGIAFVKLTSRKPLKENSEH